MIISDLLHGRLPVLITEGRDAFGEVDCADVMSYILCEAVKVCPEYVGTIFKEYNYSLHRLFQTGGTEVVAFDWAGFIGWQEYEFRMSLGEEGYHAFVIIVEKDRAELYDITEEVV